MHNRINKARTNLAVLLDTRTSQATEVEHQKSTQHKVYFNSFASKTQGVAIIVKDSCPITDIKEKVMISGNLKKFYFTYRCEKYTLTALYAPNEKICIT